MSLLNLLYLNDNDADRVIGGVRQWCAIKGFDLDSAPGREAIDLAVRLTKIPHFSDDLLSAMLQETAHLTCADISRQILIVEDEPLIAMDLEGTLNEAGFATELRTSDGAATEWLADHTPAAAILDVRLKHGSSEDVATLLTNRNVPFIVCSGADPSDSADVFSHATWLPKPCNHSHLLTKLEELLLQHDFMNAVEQRP